VRKDKEVWKMSIYETIAGYSLWAFIFFTPIGIALWRAYNAGHRAGYRKGWIARDRKANRRSLGLR
jgi:hypothetical protein